MKIKTFITASAVSLGLFGGFLISSYNQPAQTIQAAPKGFSKNWRGTWEKSYKDIKIHQHSIQYGTQHPKKVSYITKAKNGYYHIHLYKQHDVYMKRSNAGGQHILLRSTPNDSPRRFYKVLVSMSTTTTVKRVETKK